VVVEKGEQKSEVSFGVEGSRVLKVPTLLLFLSFFFTSYMISGMISSGAYMHKYYRSVSDA